MGYDGNQWEMLNQHDMIFRGLWKCGIPYYPKIDMINLWSLSLFVYGKLFFQVHIYGRISMEILYQWNIVFSLF